MSTEAIGIDIGGTGIKGALVDVDSGELLSERIKLPTPKGGTPEDIVATVLQVIAQVPKVQDGTPVGVCFPAVVQHGRTMSAANVSDEWIGLEAEKLFEQGLGRDITFVNDADAAGYAESQFGAGKGRRGLTIMTTLGTGIGSALIYEGLLIPNAELGHIALDGHEDYERVASYAAMEREGLSWKQWTKRLQKYYAHLEKLFSPDLFIVGGGVSKNYQDFFPLLDLRTEIVPAAFRNNAGILGCASLAAHGAGTRRRREAEQAVATTND
ncbi:MAG TPA: ROK family protein [Naasia sp.]